jgi:hypothetical protein
MSQAAQPTEPDIETERTLLQTAVADARADHRPSVAHDEVRAEMLRDIDRLRSKIARR